MVINDQEVTAPSTPEPMDASSQELRVADLTRSTPEPVQEPAMTQVVAGGAPARPLIIVIDDDMDFLNVIVRELKRINDPPKFDLLHAPSGDQGIALARPYFVSGQPVFVMTDYRMPGLTGTQVVQTVRREHPEASVR